MIYCWFSNQVLNVNAVQSLLIQNNITPIRGDDSGIAYEIGRQTTNPTIYNYSYGELQYLDEPLTEKLPYKIFNNVIYGETCFKFMDKLVAQGAKNICYTAYKEHLFRFFNWFNVVNPFRNQLPTIEKMFKRYPSKVNYIWLNLLSNKDDYAEIIEFAKRNRLTLLITFGWHGWIKQTPQSVEEVRECLIEFVKTLKQINGEK